VVAIDSDQDYAKPIVPFESIWIQFAIHNDTDLPTRSFSFSRTFHKPLYGKEIL
jgi:hypothetical protein